MGAHIQGHGGGVIRIEGVERLHGTHYRIISDRIETGTFLIATAMLGGEVMIEGARPEHLSAVIDKLAEANVTIERVNGALRVWRTQPLQAVEVTTLPFPGFPTDLQAQMMALMTVSHGVSVMTEKIYPERFMYTAELSRMGASIRREGPSAIVKGVRQLSGAPVVAPDLRASAALILAGLAASNQTELTGLEHFDRVYEQFE